MRLSTLGTAQLCRVPTKGDVAVPLPLPYELELTVGTTPLAADVLVVAADATVCGVTGWSTGVLAAPLVVAEPEAETFDVLPALFPPAVPKEGADRVGPGRTALDAVGAGVAPMGNSGTDADATAPPELPPNAPAPPVALASVVPP